MSLLTFIFAHHHLISHKAVMNKLFEVTSKRGKKETRVKKKVMLVT